MNDKQPDWDELMALPTEGIASLNAVIRALGLKRPVGYGLNTEMTDPAWDAVWQLARIVREQQKRIEDLERQVHDDRA